MSWLSDLWKGPPANYARRPLPIDPALIPAGAIILTSTSTRNLISWLIREVTRARVSHSILYTGGPRLGTIEAEMAGVKEDSIKSWLNDKTTMAWVWVYTREGGLRDDQRTKIVSYARGCLGKSYDISEFLGFALGDPEGCAGQEICSRLTTEAYLEPAIQTSAKSPAETAPGDQMRWFQEHPDEWTLIAVQNVKP